jgi:hypothetical protein
VTVTGSEGGNGDDGSGKNGQARTVVGAVGKVNASGFTLQPDDHGNALTVHVSAQTQFQGSLHSLADLHSGMRVTVVGTTQSDGSIAATRVATQGQGGGD